VTDVSGGELLQQTSVEAVDLLLAGRDAPVIAERRRQAFAGKIVLELLASPEHDRLGRIDETAAVI
jgi:hypothetical protein